MLLCQSILCDLFTNQSIICKAISYTFYPKFNLQTIITSNRFLELIQLFFKRYLLFITPFALPCKPAENLTRVGKTLLNSSILMELPLVLSSKATISSLNMMTLEDGLMKMAHSTIQMVSSSMMNLPVRKKRKVMLMTMILLMSSNRCSSKRKKASSGTNPKMTKSKPNQPLHPKSTTNKNPKNTSKNCRQKSN
jgi:hypothetical protein